LLTARHARDKPFAAANGAIIASKADGG